MVSSCFIHRVPGIVYMGILSNGGAGSILLLGLLTGNEAVSGSKVGTPLIVVSIILLLSITAGGTGSPRSKPRPVRASPDTDWYEQSKTILRLCKCCSFRKPSYFASTWMRGSETTALHWTQTSLEDHVCNHSPSGWEMTNFANTLSTICESEDV